MNWYKKYIFAGLPAYTLDELIFKLDLFGVRYLKEGKGDHMVFVNTNTGKKDYIRSGAGSQIINPVTMKKILDRIGVPWSVWKKLPKRPKRRDMDRVMQNLSWDLQPEQEAPAAQPESKPSWWNEPWAIQQRKLEQDLDFNPGT